MTNPIHHSAFRGIEGIESKWLGAVGFASITLTYLLVILSAEPMGFIAVFTALFVYEFYQLMIYPKMNFLSIRWISVEQLKVGIRYVLVASILTAIYGSLLLVVTSTTDISIAIYDGLSGVSLTIPVILAFTLIPSLFEEIVFRHFFQGRLLRGFSKKFRVALPTLTFVYAHLVTYSVSLSGFLTVTALIPISFAMSLLYERTQNIVAPMIVHSASNLIVLLVVVMLGI